MSGMAGGVGCVIEPKPNNFNFRFNIACRSYCTDATDTKLTDGLQKCQVPPTRHDLWQDVLIQTEMAINAFPHHDRRWAPCSFPHPGPLMELLAIRLGRQKTPAKSLVIPQGDSDFLRAKARERSYVPPAGEGACASLTRRSR
jgi:hypothetical protein